MISDVFCDFECNLLCVALQKTQFSISNLPISDDLSPGGELTQEPEDSGTNQPSVDISRHL